MVPKKHKSLDKEKNPAWNCNCNFEQSFDYPFDIHFAYYNFFCTQQADKLVLQGVPSTISIKLNCALFWLKCNLSPCYQVPLKLCYPAEFKVNCAIKIDKATIYFTSIKKVEIGDCEKRPKRRPKKPPNVPISITF